MLGSDASTKQPSHKLRALRPPREAEAAEAVSPKRVSPQQRSRANTEDSSAPTSFTTRTGGSVGSSTPRTQRGIWSDNMSSLLGGASALLGTMTLRVPGPRVHAQDNSDADTPSPRHSPGRSPKRRGWKGMFKRSSTGSRSREHTPSPLGRRRPTRDAMNQVRPERQPSPSGNHILDRWAVSTVPDVRLSDLHKERVLGKGHQGKVFLVSASDARKRSQDALQRDDDSDNEGNGGGGATSGGDNGDTVFALSTPTPLYALKVLHKDKLKSTKHQGMALREVEIMRSLDSPFHTRLVNTYRTQTRLFMLMDYAKGGDLYRQVHKSWLPLDHSDIRRYTSHLVLALEHMHERGIIHRDIKSSNLLLDEHGVLKLCNYGFARYLPSREKCTTMLGTYSYLSPEQCREQPYDHSADLWALGIVVYEMMYGTTPFESSDVDHKVFARETMQNIESAVLTFPVASTVAFTAKLFIKSILTKNPTERLGHGLNFRDIKAHSWFKNVEWHEAHRPVPKWLLSW